jgi:hypothetical protein
MHVEIENRHQYIHELRGQDDLSGVPLMREDVTQSVSQLIDEIIANAVLADRVSRDIDELRVTVAPEFTVEP